MASDLQQDLLFKRLCLFLSEVSLLKNLQVDFYTAEIVGVICRTHLFSSQQNDDIFHFINLIKVQIVLYTVENRAGPFLN